MLLWASYFLEHCFSQFSYSIMFGLSYKIQLIKFGLWHCCYPKCRVFIVVVSINKMISFWSHGIWWVKIYLCSKRCGRSFGFLYMHREFIRSNKDLWCIAFKYVSGIGLVGLWWSGETCFELRWKISHRNMRGFISDRYYYWTDPYGSNSIYLLELYCGYLV